MFILYENVDRAAVRLVHVPGISGGTLGIVPAMILAASRAVPAAADEQFLRNFVEQALISSWPLVLVTVGAVLSRERFGDGRGTLKNIVNRKCQVVDVSGGRSTLR
jgi:hypothetical protein